MDRFCFFKQKATTKFCLSQC